MKRIVLMAITAVLGTLSLNAQKLNIEQSSYDNISSKVIDWRRTIHQNPELSYQEFETAEMIAKHLESLGIEVQTGVAKTGVVGVLKGKKNGKVLALRADIDALPVVERNNLSFKSTKTTTYLGEEVGIMHACGHDTHAAILMGVAEILANNRNKIKGTVKFIFQPAEEGAPEGEYGGARTMVNEGVLKNPDVDAIVGLHINSQTPVGVVRYKPEGTMAAAQRFVINVKGKQTHGSQPWSGVDPIYISAKIIDGLQSIVSRELNLTQEAAVISVGKIKSGVRFNIIPEDAELIGTIRTLDYGMREQVRERMTKMVKTVAEAYGGQAEIEIFDTTDITYNDPELTASLIPTLNRVLGEENVILSKAVTGAEDFSYFQSEVPGFYFFLGGMSKNSTEAYPHHTPDFVIDESGLIFGVKSMTEITLNYLNAG